MDKPLLDSHGTVFKYYLFAGGIDKVVHLVPAVHHRSGDELHWPGSTAFEISGQDNLATSGPSRHDGPHDTVTCPGKK